MDYMFMPFRRYADFSGRSRRKEFWLWALFNLIVQGAFIAWVASAFFGAMASVAQRAQNGEFDSYAATADGSSTVTLNGQVYQVPPDVLLQAFSSVFGLPFMILCLWGLITFIPNLAVTVRRLHDQDKSGWMILVSLIPLIGPIWLLILYLSEGTRGPNRYGPDPKGGMMAPQAFN